MSSSHVSSYRRKHKPQKRSEEDGHGSKKIHLLKKERKSYIAGITKLINAIAKLIDQKASFNGFRNFDKSLGSHIQNIRDLTTKILGNESENNIIQPELELCSEQEFRVIQIRNTISSYFENKDVSPINLDKETNPLTLNVVSQNSSLS